LFLSHLPFSISSNIEVRNSLILPHPLTGGVDRRSILHKAMAAGVKDALRREVRSWIANPFRMNSMIHHQALRDSGGAAVTPAGASAAGGDGQDQCLSRGVEPPSGRLGLVNHPPRRKL
jgi:hypothetical protein